MKITLNYESEPEQIISRYILCPFCSENIEGTKIGDDCQIIVFKMGSKLT